MKRYILIAAIFLAVASVAQAQMSGGSEQRQQKTNNGSTRIVTLNGHSNVNNSSPASIRLPKQVNGSSTKRWKENTPNAVYQRTFQRNANYRYNEALDRMRDAQYQKMKAEKALAELSEKQQLEKAKLQELFKQSMPEGWENEQWMIDELQKLEKKHAKQIDKAQEKVRKATKRYDEAVKKVRDTRFEISRRALVRFT